MKTNNTTQSPVFYCKSCEKYVEKYNCFMDMLGPAYSCVNCGGYIYPQYLSEKDLRKLKLDEIDGS